MTANLPAVHQGSDLEALGNLLASSGFFQDSRDAAQAAVKVLAGQELGFGPIAAMTGIYIVKGRVTLSANLMAAAIKRHPRYDYRVVELTDERAEIAFFQEGEQIGTSEFSMDDAKRAGLAGGENYRKFPRNMLMWRALSNGAKFYCPDAFSGAPVYTPDELGAEVDPETGEIVEVENLSEATPEPVKKSRKPKEEPPPPSLSERHAISAEREREAEKNGKPEPEPEPERLTPEPPPDPVDEAKEEFVEDRQINEEELGKLTDQLQRVEAPESFWRMALMGYHVEELSDLKVSQAREMMRRANDRFKEKQS